MDEIREIAFTSNRRFGVELEVNSLDKRDFQLHPLDTKKNELPNGIDYIANLISKEAGVSVSIRNWQSTHNNDCWVLKPDRSCGLEICSPVCKGWSGLKSICEVSEVIKRDKKIPIDNRCSLHVHVEVTDCSRVEVAKILAYWVKCESIFLDSVPNHRKRNRYCQCVGMTDLFEHNTVFDEDLIIKKLGMQKYYTINCYHYYKEDRNTIEFRIVESDGCSDPFLIKNWIRLLIHFIECAKAAPIPSNYSPNDSASGFCWLDLEDVMKFLGFIGDASLSKGMEQTRNWFIARIYKNISNQPELPGIWSEVARKISKEQLVNVISNLKLSLSDMETYLKSEDVEFLYSDEYK